MKMKCSFFKVVFTVCCLIEHDNKNNRKKQSHFYWGSKKSQAFIAVCIVESGVIKYRFYTQNTCSRHLLVELFSMYSFVELQLSHLGESQIR